MPALPWGEGVWAARTARLPQGIQGRASNRGVAIQNAGIASWNLQMERVDKFKPRQRFYSCTMRPCTHRKTSVHPLMNPCTSYSVPSCLVLLCVWTHSGAYPKCPLSVSTGRCGVGCGVWGGVGWCFGGIMMVMVILRCSAVMMSIGRHFTAVEDALP